jgi:hypothetical protein
LKPSIMRRARLISPQSHFSYVSPLPLPFPYRITAPDPSITQYDKAEWVEHWLSAHEAVHPPEGRQDSPLSYPHNRDHPRELIGLAETGWKDCLPHLDVGDALATLGTPSLAHFLDDDPKNPLLASEEDVRVRQELVDVLSGHCLLVRSGSKSISTEAENQPCLAPWSLRYSGHQFGSWAGQLGDGRAISVRTCVSSLCCQLVSNTIHQVVTPHPSDPDLTYELQLKGSGRTPFSRLADGLAVLRSSIREYLAAEGTNSPAIPEHLM